MPNPPCAQVEVLPRDIVEMHERGFDILAYPRPHKRPLEDKWESLPRKSLDDLRAFRRTHPDCNFGLRLGRRFNRGAFFVGAFDMDIEPDGDVAGAHKFMDDHCPQWRDLPRYISGRGGPRRQVLFLSSVSLGSHKRKFGSGNGWTIELRVEPDETGLQSVLPPSVSAYGPYSWERKIDFDNWDLIGVGFDMLLSEASVERILAELGSRSDPGNGVDIDEDTAELLAIANNRPLSNVSIETVKSVLDCLQGSPKHLDDRDGWLEVGMGIHHQFEGTDEGLDLWREFSRPSSKFDEKVLRRQWKSFGSKPGKKSVTFASLIAAAKELGWVAPKPPEQPRPVPDAGGDDALARAFAARVKGKMRFNRTDGAWMQYVAAEGAWRRCERDEESQEMLKCARRRFEKSCDIYRADPSDANKRQQAECASYLKNAHLIGRALIMAKGHPDIVCVSGDFNADPYAFPVSNGLVDLRTGKLTPPSPELMIAKRSPAKFDAAAKCPRFDAMMLRILPDPEIRDFVRLAAGYSLTGLVDEEKVFLAYGKGRNGKSTFANVLAELLGEFTITVSPLLFTKAGDSSEGDRQIASLVGKRLCLANEAAQAAIWRDDRLKMLASRESLQARYLHREVFNFFPSHKIWFRTNNLPGAHDGGDGFWRRLVAIPFTEQIPENEVIGDLDRQIIREELSGVLNWAITGARDYLAAGRLIVPKALARITAEYREGCDLIGQWLGDRVNVETGGKMLVADAYQSLTSFYAQEGVRPPAKITFSKSLNERGHKTERGTRGAKYFPGLKLREFDAEELSDE